MGDRGPLRLQAAPPSSSSGAQMVEDVEAYELMKLRMLNGSHSTMAYLGYLAGYQYVNEAIADPAITRPHSRPDDQRSDANPADGQGRSSAATATSSSHSFANPALKHRTWQIAMDGSQKLPQRLLGTIRDHIAAGTPYTRCALGVAAWMRYVTGIDEKGELIDVKDPLGGPRSGRRRTHRAATRPNLRMPFSASGKSSAPTCPPTPTSATRSSLT